MRGKGTVKVLPLVEVGITPAYAGKSAALSCHPNSDQDHPRVCGEKHSSAPAAHNDTGSPPRMRGKE